METILYFRNDSSNKFWKIKVTGVDYVVTFGKAGTTGTIRSKKFDHAAECLKEAESMIQSKLKKGYKPGHSSMQLIKKSTITDDSFWSLLEQAKKKGEEQEEQLEWLVEHLSKKPLQDIIKFDEIFARYFVRSCTSSLWAAACIIMGGCSDDCFDYFRAWLLFQGKGVYETAIHDPESMIPILKELEEKGEMPQFEDLTYLGALAFEEKTGRDDTSYYELYDQLVADPCFEPEIELDWDEEDEKGLQIRFPKLWERYGENPLEC
ncbi:DUF4240 domain-containing protein [Metabacillus sp. 113a]|uniref:DUF4240 domain-containing protein n=1 Tax=Metabacillus sp. 113a TaxID=3404706 RepID=UPI003CE75412